jgi:predicted dehydrogenase
VEKPCSHNLWEGRQIVRAAAKYDRIVQHGTQYRSNATVRQAIKEIRAERSLVQWSIQVSNFHASRPPRAEPTVTSC